MMFMRCLFIVAFVGLAVSADEKPKLIRGVIETEKGNIEVELYADKGPATVANFLRYVVCQGAFLGLNHAHRPAAFRVPGSFTAMECQLG